MGQENDCNGKISIFEKFWSLKEQNLSRGTEVMNFLIFNFWIYFGQSNLKKCMGCVVTEMEPKQAIFLQI